MTAARTTSTASRCTRAPIIAALLCALTGLAALSTPAAAQGAGITPFPVKPRPTMPTASPRTNGGVTISVSYQFFIEGSPETIDEQAGLSEKGRKAVYALLAKECTALLETIAESCEIQRANVSSQMNAQTSRFREGGIRVSGSATYRITLKSAGTGKSTDN